MCSEHHCSVVVKEKYTTGALDAPRPPRGAITVHKQEKGAGMGVQSYGHLPGDTADEEEGREREVSAHRFAGVDFSASLSAVELDPETTKSSPLASSSRWSCIVSVEQTEELLRLKLARQVELDPQIHPSRTAQRVRNVCLLLSANLFLGLNRNYLEQHKGAPDRLSFVPQSVRAFVWERFQLQRGCEMGFGYSFCRKVTGIFAFSRPYKARLKENGLYYDGFLI
ncbi:hypothetical protein B0H11DRAFT_1905908 [Mycena galericulata]|nr:hypothetical protein B0H11DRAFT_1905908 [Mycena galericulata]